MRSSAGDETTPALKEMISKVSYGHTAEGLHNLAQHAIGELQSYSSGSFSSRTYTSVRFQPLCSEDSQRLTTDPSVSSYVIELVASRGSTSSSSPMAFKARH
jgi:hypothetical protein